MRNTVLMSVAALGLSAGTAVAQSQPSQTIRPGHVPGVGESYPASSQASNINGSDTRSTIAPRLPEPTGGPGAGADHYIREAQRALMAHRSGEAQQAIEMAETRLLDRSVVATETSTPDQNPAVAGLEAARQAIAKHDWRAAEQNLSQALTQTATAGGTPMAPMPDTASGMNGTAMSSRAQMMSSPGGMANGAGGGMNGAAIAPFAPAPFAPGGTAPDQDNGMQPMSAPNQQP